MIGTNSPTAAMILPLLAVLPIAVYCALQQDMLTSLFPAERRVLGTGLTQSIGIALFGGTTELIALSFKSAATSRPFRLCRRHRGGGVAGRGIAGRAAVATARHRPGYLTTQAVRHVLVFHNP